MQTKIRTIMRSHFNAHHSAYAYFLQLSQLFCVSDRYVAREIDSCRYEKLEQKYFLLLKFVDAYFLQSIGGFQACTVIKHSAFTTKSVIAGILVLECNFSGLFTYIIKNSLFATLNLRDLVLSPQSFPITFTVRYSVNCLRLPSRCFLFWYDFLTNLVIAEEK
ncbi:hypothetical protein EGR_08961 [Echinococcus granulosus]|uniref:Uncharacterized protein n=1 Tax=Echinococcus granulosus TaxID=6210 RepID=W6U703_ECHGR|nr:hypothetical protein EGR_08961 [Echinococcus granulosus]EUB56156.1 hypothetical protein EGR_08961 [Echinococcus granulosus]